MGNGNTNGVMKMFEVGKTYTAANGHKYTCIAVNDTHAWLSSSANTTAYVWNQNGKSTLGQQWDIIIPAREYWICDLGCVYGYPVPGAIHVREVLPE